MDVGQQNQATSVVFLSHTSIESEMADAVKALIVTAFPSIVEVFVSSDAETIAYGTRWPDRIEDALRRCVVQLVLCSPLSVVRPWINFEVGACWIRDIPVIPLCHSGLDRATLQPPLNVLQAGNLSDEEHVQRMLRTIAQRTGQAKPEVELKPFLELVRNLEEQYTFWDRFEASFHAALAAVGRNGRRAFLSGSDTRIMLSEIAISELERGAQFLIASGLVAVERDYSSFSDGSGEKLGIMIRFSDRYRELLAEYARLFNKRNVRS
jgi:hypothetical protein